MPRTKTSDPDIQRKWARNKEKFEDAEETLLEELKKYLRENREQLSKEFMGEIDNGRTGVSKELARFRLGPDRYS
jgi:hypothetical protein